MFSRLQERGRKALTIRHNSTVNVYILTYSNISFDFDFAATLASDANVRGGRTSYSTRHGYLIEAPESQALTLTWSVFKWHSNPEPSEKVAYLPAIEFHPIGKSKNGMWTIPCPIK